jgi:hypothetical protein
MIAAVLLAVVVAATPTPAAPRLGLWPANVGGPATEVKGIEFYVVEPEDDFWILAVQPLTPALAAPEDTALERLAETAKRLGADAVLLMEELPVEKIPADPDAPLVGTGAFSAAAYLVFDCACAEQAPRVYRARLLHRRSLPPDLAWRRSEAAWVEPPGWEDLNGWIP